MQLAVHKSAMCIRVGGVRPGGGAQFYKVGGRPRLRTKPREDTGAHKETGAQPRLPRLSCATSALTHAAHLQSDARAPQGPARVASPQRAVEPGLLQRTAQALQHDYRLHEPREEGISALTSLGSAAARHAHIIALTATHRALLLRARRHGMLVRLRGVLGGCRGVLSQRLQGLQLLKLREEGGSGWGTGGWGCGVV